MATGRSQKGMNSRIHHDSLSQSGQKNYSSQTPKPQRGGGGGRGSSVPRTLGDAFFGPGPKTMSHGSGKRKKKG